MHFYCRIFWNSIICIRVFTVHRDSFSTFQTVSWNCTLPWGLWNPSFPTQALTLPLPIAFKTFLKKKKKKRLFSIKTVLPNHDLPFSWPIKNLSFRILKKNKVKGFSLIMSLVSFFSFTVKYLERRVYTLTHGCLHFLSNCSFLSFQKWLLFPPSCWKISEQRSTATLLPSLQGQVQYSLFWSYLVCLLCSIKQLSAYPTHALLPWFLFLSPTAPSKSAPLRALLPLAIMQHTCFLGLILSVCRFSIV